MVPNIICGDKRADTHRRPMLRGWIRNVKEKKRLGYLEVNLHDEGHYKLCMLHLWSPGTDNRLALSVRTQIYMYTATRYLITWITYTNPYT